MSWGQVLVALICTGIAVQSSPCSWVKVLYSWRHGYKAVAKLQMNETETVDHWDVAVEFSESVIHFEAWKGHVNKISDTNFTVSNTCYNNIVYKGQCFMLPYFVRHEPIQYMPGASSGWSPNPNQTNFWKEIPTFKFNGELVPTCDTPSCGIEAKKASPTCSPDGVLLPTALPEDHPLWFPSAHFNLTIVGLVEVEKASLKLAFDQALVLAAAYNHDLGYKTLHKAYTSSNSSSPHFECCLCLWALAYLNAPNLNRKCTSYRLAVAKTAAQEAFHRCLNPNKPTEISDLERKLVSAMVARFAANRTDDNGVVFDTEFALKMGKIATNESLHMDNAFVTADLHVFYAEAVMHLIGWDYYNKLDGNLRDEAKDAKKFLDRALSIDPGHILANHLTIHLLEASSDSKLIEKAEEAGNTLRSLIPKNLGAGLGHLLHMPSHAYSRTGRYNEAVVANQEGIADDSIYFSYCNVSKNDFYRLNYYTHKHAFLIWAATMSGASKVALKLFEYVNIVEVARKPAMNGRVFFSYPNWKYQIRITFGKFDKMEELLEPTDSTGNELLDKYMKAMFFFARSYARASKSNKDCRKSNKDRKKFLDYANNETLRNKKLGRIHVKNLLDLSKNILNGRLCGRKCGNWNCSEVEYLSTAVAILDSFPYDEPRYWPDHVRACLGAALLREDKPEQALAVFEKDLSKSQYPNNIWSLKGKHMALSTLNREDEAFQVGCNLTEALKNADVALLGPCF